MLNRFEKFKMKHTLDTRQMGLLFQWQSKQNWPAIKFIGHPIQIANRISCWSVLGVVAIEYQFKFRESCSLICFWSWLKTSFPSNWVWKNYSENMAVFSHTTPIIKRNLYETRGLTLPNKVIQHQDRHHRRRKVNTKIALPWHEKLKPWQSLSYYIYAEERQKGKLLDERSLKFALELRRRSTIKSHFLRIRKTRL